MSTNDTIGLLVSYAYAMVLLASGEGLRRIAGLPQELTRKWVHIGAGMWVFGILALFDTWQIGVIPFATFILVNALLYRYRLAASVDARDSTPGTVYFAAAITLLFVLLWRPDGPQDYAPAAIAGVMALTWGDATAALVGRRIGRNRYRLGLSNRSWEGSAVMFVVSAIVILLTLLLLPGSALAPNAASLGTGRAVITALLAAAAATLAEAAAPRGSDNLSVPLVVAALVWLAYQF